MALYWNGKEQNLNLNGKLLAAVYYNGKLIWQGIRSCFGIGAWFNSRPWVNEEAWRNK